ncbi:hypothetical protein PsYK624_105120 [Phanerochaete sordida]|uniref:F-box domain-containing protein n=1 Tax=Phanerochaete sordida TaxID=48140 RepID=A0A9P3GG75_9APHY|nr:hypothetical protein PsYK624_105120 [Phanerochaete sordida]
MSLGLCSEYYGMIAPGLFREVGAERGACPKLRKIQISQVRNLLAEMHQAFTVGDVVGEIVSYLERSTLISLTTTCKTLSGPALDALWREMVSLDPLYQTLPSGVWTKDGDGKLMTGPDIPGSPEDWARFTAYASRIRDLSFAEDTSELRPDFLQLLAFYLPSVSSPPLPSLQTLRIGRPYPDMELALCVTTLAHPGHRIVVPRDCHHHTLSRQSLLPRHSHTEDEQNEWSFAHGHPLHASSDVGLR